jgi:hypothetical protein
LPRPASSIDAAAVFAERPRDLIPGDLNILKDGTDVVSHALGDVAGDDGVVERSVAVSGLDSYPSDADMATLTRRVAQGSKGTQNIISFHFEDTASLCHASA